VSWQHRWAVDAPVGAPTLRWKAPSIGSTAIHVTRRDTPGIELRRAHQEMVKPDRWKAFEMIPPSFSSGHESALFTYRFTTAAATWTAIRGASDGRDIDAS